MCVIESAQEGVGVGVGVGVIEGLSIRGYHNATKMT